MIKMSTKSLSKLTAVLTKAFSSKLPEAEVSTVLENCNTELTKVLSHRTKRKKDVNAPKKWKTGYILFCQDKREEIKKNNPTLSTTDITSRLGAMWKSLKPVDKEKYNKRSNVDKERYDAEMKNYVPPVGEASETKTRRKRDKSGPRKSLSAYFLFCNDKREKVKADNPTFNNKQVTTELGRLWKALSEKDRTPYAEKASIEKARYEAEKAKYEAEKANGANNSANNSNTVQVVEPEPKSSKPSKSGKADTRSNDTKSNDTRSNDNTTKGKKGRKPAKDKVSAKNEPGFTLFCQEKESDLRRKNSSWSNDKVMAELEKQWNKMKPEDRLLYNEDAEDNVSVAALEDE